MKVPMKILSSMTSLDDDVDEDVVRFILNCDVVRPPW